MRSPTHGQFSAGLHNVRSAKLRSFWTMLGIIIGVTSVITVVSLGQGIKQQIGGQVHQLGQNVITIRPAQLGTGGSIANATNANLLSGLSVSGPLSLTDINLVSQTKGVAASAPLTITSGTVHGNYGVYNDGFVIGTTRDLPSLLNQSLAYGNFFDSTNNGSNVAVLGFHASEALFNEDVPLGRHFVFHGQQFTVIGIFNDFSAAPLSQQANFNNAIFIPNAVAESLTKDTAPTYEILARAANDHQTAAVAGRLKTALNQAHGGQSNLSILTGNQSIAANDAVLALLTRLIAGVAAISLLVGGVGIMNVMLVSVAERMHEIGIRKAVGATNRQIMGQFVMEATILSLTGGVIGIILAFLIDISLRAATNLTPIISWQLVLLASGVSFLVGLVFGSAPAIKAAYKDPIEALRSE